jgi:DNA-binding XRE family transcriptional regulator
MTDVTLDTSQDCQPESRQNWRSKYISTIFLLRRRREELNMTQAHVAARIGMSLRTYQRTEAGDRDFTAPELYHLAHLLGLSLTASPLP